MSKYSAVKLHRQRPLFDKAVEYGAAWDSFKRNNPLTHRICEKCGSDENLQRHHIIPVKKKGRHAAANIKVLCETCHEKLHPHMLRNKKRKKLPKY